MSEQPNFLFFCVDQMRADHMACAGNPVVQTPSLDALAADGVRFDRAYCSNPLCMPSRATLFTGLTPRGHEVRTNGIPLDPRYPTVGEALGDAGWRTHSVGKLHMRPFGTPEGLAPEDIDPLEWPESRSLWYNGRLKAVPTPYYGFQSVELITSHGHNAHGDYGRWLDAQHPRGQELMRPDAGQPSPRGADRTWTMALPEELHYNTWVADRTIAFLDAQPAGEPFFAWCSFPDPHPPYGAPEPWASMYDPADVAMPTRREGELDDLAPLFREVCEQGRWCSGRTSPTLIEDAWIRDVIAMTFGMISFVDAQIGRVMAALERLGLRENTVVCFLCDHGDMMGDHWLLNKGPFHFDGLLRQPLIFAGPGIERGVEAQGLASWLDIAPTMLDLAGVAMPEGEFVAPEPALSNQLAALPGNSLAPVLHGEAPSVQDSVIAENDEDHMGLRLRTLVTERYKITAYPGQPFGELFDLQEDPEELHNLWGDPTARETRRDLLVRLMERLVETDNRLPRRITHA